MGWLDSFQSFAGNLGITLLTASVAAWGVLKFAGGKWLEDRFARELENHKADIARTLDRAYKLHATEMEVLPKLWRLFGEAEGYVGSALALFRYTGDPGLLTDDQLRAEMEKREFEPVEIDQVLKGDRFTRTKLFSDAEDRQRMRKAFDAIYALRNYANETSIFTADALHHQILDWCRLANDAVWERHMTQMEAASGPVDRDQRKAAKDARKAWVDGDQRIAPSVRSMISQVLWRDIPKPLSENLPTPDLAENQSSTPPA